MMMGLSGFSVASSASRIKKEGNQMNRGAIGFVVLILTIGLHCPRAFGADLTIPIGGKSDSRIYLFRC